MPRGSKPMLHAPALALVLLGIVLQSPEADAQERARIEVVPQLAHAGDVKAAAFTRDGAHVLTGSKDGTLKLWDLATTRLVRTFVGHKGEITAVALSPDGSRALSGSEDKTVRLWEVATGRLMRTIYAHLDSSQRGQLRGLLARWQASLVEQQRGRRSQAVGRGDRTARAHVPARQGLVAFRRPLGRVLAGRHPPGHRRHRRQARERLELGVRAAPPGLRRARPGLHLPGQARLLAGRHPRPGGRQRFAADLGRLEGNGGPHPGHARLQRGIHAVRRILTGRGSRADGRGR